MSCCPKHAHAVPCTCCPLCTLHPAVRLMTQRILPGRLSPNCVSLLPLQVSAHPQPILSFILTLGLSAWAVADSICDTWAERAQDTSFPTSYHLLVHQLHCSKRQVVGQGKRLLCTASKPSKQGSCHQQRPLWGCRDGKKLDRKQKQE